MVASLASRFALRFASRRGLSSEYEDASGRCSRGHWNASRFHGNWDGLMTDQRAVIPMGAERGGPPPW
jgi:hypothetical protein